MFHAAMLFNESVYIPHIQALADDCRIVEQPLHISFQFPPEQVLDREAVSLLAPVYHFVWKEIDQSGAEDVLGLHSLQFPVSRQRGDKFHEDMIKQRYSDLQRTGHAHPVHFHEDTVGHHKAHIQIDLPVDLIYRIAFPCITTYLAERIPDQQIIQSLGK